RITKRVMQAESDLTEDSTLTFKDVQLLQEVLHSLKLRLQSVYDFYHGYDPMFTWWVPQPYQQLSEYMDRYAVALHTQVERAIFDDGSGIGGNPRSEEHTSELQSRENIVCRLLLE